jgi:hypothetical protein
MRATYSAYLIFDLITLIIFGEESNYEDAIMQSLLSSTLTADKKEP